MLRPTAPSRLRRGRLFTGPACCNSVTLGYPWPGNVRELKHAIERAYILVAGDTLSADALFEDGMPEQAAEVPETCLAEYLQNCERRYIVSALNRHGWHMGNTALALGISRKNLWEKMKRLNVEAPAKDGTRH